ncbi:hypothetical protein NK356_20345 [Chryseobacterium sp. S0630]|nr:hypothetical protein [Chryseobacterium sp. S0630]MCP1301535.1 hypothetical protein [Chryseobacterium sp. S0630]
MNIKNYNQYSTIKEAEEFEEASLTLTKRSLNIIHIYPYYWADLNGDY